MAFALKPGLLVEERFLGELGEQQLREMLDRIGARA
jgi:hypothetical protein